MTIKKLTPEIISLIHHIELNQSGWWNQIMSKVALAACWLSQKEISAKELCEACRSLFNVQMSVKRAEEYLEILKKENKILPGIDGTRFKLAEQTRNYCEEMSAKLMGLEEKSSLKFKNLLLKHNLNVNPDEVWRTFNDEWLIPTIKEMGARTYQLISTTPYDFRVHTTHDEFLILFPEEIRANIRDCVVAFLDPSDGMVRDYILSRLNAYFFIEATSLSEESLCKLNAASKAKADFFIFADTNFLFSVLEWHDNPSNEAATTLSKLIQSLKKHLNIKIYALPSTVEEMKSAIFPACERIKTMRLTPNLAQALLGSGSCYGLLKKFANECVRTGLPLSGDAFCGPYATDLLSILRDKGVELYNAKTDSYNMRQDVVDDILEQQAFFEKRKKDHPEIPFIKAKSYSQIEHDMVLWHFTNDKRLLEDDSPMEVKYWILTVDFSLLGFDGHKQKMQKKKIPICLHPTSFIQLLRFWVPRSEEIEKGVLGGMRLPFIFQEFDVSGERLTIKIIDSLNRFENINDMSVEALQKILTNTALRSKLKGEHEEEKQIKLIKDALIDLHIEIDEENKRLKREKDDLLEALERQRGEREEALGKQNEKISTMGKSIEKYNAELLAKSEEIQRMKREECEKEEAVKGRALRKNWMKKSVLAVISLVSILIVITEMAAFFAEGHNLLQKCISIWVLYTGFVTVWWMFFQWMKSGDLYQKKRKGAHKP